MMNRFRREEGFTLVEIIVFLGMFGGILTILFNALTTTQVSLERQSARAQSNDEVRLAAQAIDREVRSGDLISNPQAEDYSAKDIVPYYSFRVLSEANVPTRGDKRCVQYRITSGGELQRRSWRPLTDDASDWRTLATGVRNRVEGVPAFSRPQTNLLQVTLLANARPGTGLISGQVKTVRIDLSVSGRNSVLVEDTNQCGSSPQPGVGGVPSYP